MYGQQVYRGELHFPSVELSLFSMELPTSNLEALLACALIKPSDVDIFAVSEEAAHCIAAEIGPRPGHPYVETAHVIALGDGPLPIQIIKPAQNWHVFPDDIMTSFDLSGSRALVQH